MEWTRPRSPTGGLLTAIGTCMHGVFEPEPGAMTMDESELAQHQSTQAFPMPLRPPIHCPCRPTKTKLCLCRSSSPSAPAPCSPIGLSRISRFHWPNRAPASPGRSSSILGETARPMRGKPHPEGIRRRVSPPSRLTGPSSSFPLMTLVSQIAKFWFVSIRCRRSLFSRSY
jgi:hypothetical protein